MGGVVCCRIFALGFEQSMADVQREEKQERVNFSVPGVGWGSS